MGNPDSYSFGVQLDPTGVIPCFCLEPNQASDQAEDCEYLGRVV